MRRKFLRTASVVFALCMAFTGCSSDDSDAKKESGKESGQTESTADKQDDKQEDKQDSASQVKGTIEYAFDDSVKDKAGYAQGSVTFQAEKKGDYKLYWSDNEKILDGYYEVAALSLENDNDKATVDFAYHVAIPADATKLIAVAADESKESYTVSEAVAVYDIPENKQIKSENVIYKFSSISDVHIDEEKWGETLGYWWEYSEDHWAKALQYAVDKDVDFIVSSGDQVTNAKLATLDKEWQAYQYILAKSDYCNPIYECGGNHEVRQDGSVAQELASYIKGSGLDNDIEAMQQGKSYYYINEPTTGDLFIFMSLQGGYRPAQYDEFTTEQLDWLEGLLKENYGKGKNIYLVQHALISGYGVGDDLEKPYYAGSMKKDLETTQRFISLLEQYKDIVWISGHSHEDYSLEYNFSDNEGASCKMIHNSSVSNPNHVVSGALNYDFDENLSQGYFVQVFGDAIIFSGANNVDKKIYPMYSYIMDGTTSKQDAAKTEETQETVDVTAGNLRSVISHAEIALGLSYEYSSYNQYQDLKKMYYEYKDADIDALSDEDRNLVYAQFKEKISVLNTVVTTVESMEINALTTAQ